MTIQNEYILNPVTALAFFNSEDGRQLLLVGEGCFIKIFELEGSRLLVSLRALKTQTIHGISIAETDGSAKTDTHVVIWGGTSYIALSMEALDLILLKGLTSLLHMERIAPDWLLDAAISPFTARRPYVFATAHSAALYIPPHWHSPQAGPMHLSSPSRSVLYSAAILWTSESSFMIAAGTMFGEIEIIVWNLNSGSGELLYSFVGHEGSIFGVSISPEVLDTDGNVTRLLASCSDDRTVRVWKIESSSSSNRRGPKIAQPSSSDSPPIFRETGFGNNTAQSSDLAETQLLAMNMGHISRIWGVRFFIGARTVPPTVKDVNILSFGEDATVHQWHLADGHDRIEDSASLVQANKNTKFSLHLKKVFAYHSGKHIWSSALLSVGPGQSKVATGGADGKIAMHHVLSHHFEDQFEQGAYDLANSSSLGNAKTPYPTTEPCAIQAWTIQLMTDNGSHLPASQGSTHLVDTRDEVDITRVQKTGNTSRDSLNQYGFISASILLVTTYSGRILVGSLEPGRAWREISSIDIAWPSKVYWAVATLSDKRAAVIGCINDGSIYLASASGRFHTIGHAKDKIAGLFPIPKATDELYQILVTMLGSDEAEILSIDPDRADDTILKERRSVMLPAGFIVTSAARVADYVILGSRKGSLAIYRMAHDGEDSVMAHYTYQLKIREAVTTIVRVSEKDSTGTPYFLITARDGSYSIFSILETPPPPGQPEAPFLHLVHQASPPLGPWIEAAWFEDSRLYLSGFRSKNFVVWNETDQVEVMNVNCGGAHRVWAYSPRRHSEGAGQFAFTKSAILHIYSQDKSSHSVIKRGGHGREIKACAVLNEKSLIATGAEDTSIRLWQYIKAAEDEYGTYECCAVIAKHVTGIQALKWGYWDNKLMYLFSAAGNEEFHVWTVSEVPGFGVGVICETTLDDLSEEHDLRIVAFDVMSISHIEATSGEMTCQGAHLVCLGFSDSTIKVYLYSLDKTFIKIVCGRYTSACLTQLRVIPWNSSYRILTASTDGRLALWDFGSASLSPYESIGMQFQKMSTSSAPADLTLLLQVLVHQSSVLALDIHQLSEEAFIVASGGDDNSLALTYFHEGTPVRRLAVPAAHAAAVTGVSFMQTQNDKVVIDQGYLSICTAGEDQKIKHWRIAFDPKACSEVGMGMKLMEMEEGDEINTSVADAAGLVVLRGSDVTTPRCLVYGNGLEVFKIIQG